MKAWIISEFGDISKLKVANLEERPLNKGEIRVKIAYAGVNPVDWKIREGYLSGMFKHHFPLILGWDVAGVVSEVSSTSGQFKVGDRVFAYIRKDEVGEGGYAESVAIPESFAALVPDTVDLSKAAGVPLVGLTAYQAITEAATAKAGESILVINSTGGVGSFATQISKVLKLNVTSISSAKNEQYTRNLGTTHFVAREDKQILNKLKSIAPGGFDIVLDLWGGELQSSYFEVIKPKTGRFISIVDTPNATLAAQKEVKAGFHFVYPSQAHLTQLANWLKSNEVQLPPTQEIPASQAPRAMELSQSGVVQGKLVLDISKF
jgi:NADPH2:quinone reductase